jgi:hypothetical protein
LIIEADYGKIFKKNRAKSKKGFTADMKISSVTPDAKSNSLSFREQRYWQVSAARLWSTALPTG